MGKKASKGALKGVSKARQKKIARTVARKEQPKIPNKAAKRQPNASSLIATHDSNVVVLSRPGSSTEMRIPESHYPSVVEALNKFGGLSVSMPKAEMGQAPAKKRGRPAKVPVETPDWRYKAPMALETIVVPASRPANKPHPSDLTGQDLKRQRGRPRKGPMPSVVDLQSAMRSPWVKDENSPISFVCDDENAPFRVYRAEAHGRVIANVRETAEGYLVIEPKIAGKKPSKHRNLKGVEIRLRFAHLGQ